MSATFPTAREFREWLEHQCGPVGKTGAGGNCPLANYLTSKCSRRYVVGSETYSADKPMSAALRLPVWAQKFVYQLDGSAGGSGVVVTDKQCLAELRNVAPRAFE